jgi:DNA-directed RNA polymerase III subunit RPC2
VQGPVSQHVTVTNIPTMDATVSVVQGPQPVKHKLFDIFSEDVRTRTALAVFLMTMQQLSGIDGVLYVSDYTPFLRIRNKI